VPAFPYVTDLVDWIFGVDWKLPIPTFGVLVAVAIAVATRVARQDVERQELSGRLPPSTRAILGDLVLICALAGLVGARIFAIADYPEELIRDPAAMIFSRSGFSIYGGLCFGLCAGIGYLKRRAIPIAPMLDAVAPAMMLGYGLGRLGCQMAGDGDWGILADMRLKPAWLPDWLWAQTYDGNILGVTLPFPGVYPTPLYECLTALCLFAVLRALRSPQHRPGYLFSVYSLLAGFERLLIEKIRVNVRHDLFGYYLTQAEVVSMAIVVAGIVGALMTLRTRMRWKIVFSLGALAALSACTPF
jgi:phosphatidylglycerol---prolipoprotein diacylglyceryl transferase